MRFWDRLFGRKQKSQPQQRPVDYNEYGREPQGLSDQQAIERYRYMLRTAPPELIEQAHEEAFAKLTPERRRMVLQQLRETLPHNERSLGANAQDDPKSLARMATRAEIRQPGTMERAFGQMGPGMGSVGFGGMGFGSTLLTSIAGGFIGSAIAQQFFDAGDPGFDAGDYADTAAVDESGGETGDDWGSDVGDAGGFGAGDFGDGGDFSGDFGDGGDFGGDFSADV